MGAVKNLLDNVGIFASDVGDALGIGAQRRQQEFNSAEAAKEREWQEHMRDTSITSAMQQYKENGLNPALAYINGGETAPAGASASSVIQGNNVNGIAGILNSAAKLLNANDNTKDYATRKEVYDSTGKLVKTVMTAAKLMKG